MGTSNPFEVVFALSAIAFIVIAIFTVFAPSLGLVTPTAPAWPGFASNLDWTFTLTNWAALGSVFATIGGLFVFIGSYFIYLISMAGLLFSILTLGFIPSSIATVITVLLGITLFGAILVYVRGGPEK